MNSCLKVYSVLISFIIGVQKPFVYVISDFTENIVDFCKKHKRMEEHIQKGIVDFAVFSIFLHYSLI